MRLADFDFELPEARIALRPAAPRDAARLLVVAADATLSDRHVRDLPDLLAPGDALVFNDTRVIAARLRGVRTRDGSAVAVEATLLKRVSSSRWTAFARPGRRLAVGDRIAFGEANDRACALSDLNAEVVAKHEGGELTLAFALAGPDLDLAIEAHGAMPLPPYIAGRRAEDARDFDDYQTVYAREDGSVAAPTAGLHFTPQ
ncbi:MAG TPA: S-adenosylmethionine:tRNA ribosyltransferase-isomerase, partial [Caulobacteraceae bacterium]|nr:S-adenosylmethionine:tRNA ribosyltransferase-isomerase [Caulobacteraceae bacterium]